MDSPEVALTIANATVASRAVLHTAIEVCGRHDLPAVIGALVSALSTAIATAETPDPVLDEVIALMGENRARIAGAHRAIYAEIARQGAGTPPGPEGGPS